MNQNPSVTINASRLLERFLRYVRIDTAADPTSDEYPSTQKQRTLARLLEQELVAMSISDAHMDENALVWGTVPATNGGDTPAVALVAHIDTSPEAPSANVTPQVIEAYAGGDISLPSGIEISFSDTPELASMIGKTLVTTDGTTLLGGDDKAGIAIIMELAETLIENPHLQHGDVRLLFTCDEEIGHGTDKIDLEKLSATVAYTVDGGGAGDIDVETFSADGATVRFTGNNIHPAIAKDVMLNAVRAAADFVAELPRDDMTPETTSDRQGFIHPNAIHGGVGEATVELILRSFDSKDLDGYADIVRAAAETAAKKTPGVKADVKIYRQYRNLREGLEKLPQAVEFAEQAFKNLGRPCSREIVRGGTDGSQLTEKGLPTPNLSSGQHNIHSVREFACLDEMVEATEYLVELLALWSTQRS
ncbi:peptidase T [Rhodopirellula maiorica SM1]|uniref:Peptidase T n=1 Tax=Rhodopirellula maiorica SM1 TaxID=1265738 RepID=M5RNN8_9BACT|nr:peptidase T [Rhodopirellula maiorica]EMI20943.1 peptidase T [Rhodopirellula maiorica SM1]